MSFLIVLAALCFLMWVAYRGYSVILFAPIAALGAVFLTDPGLVAPMFTGLFMDKMVGFLKLYFPVFLLGAVFGMSKTAVRPPSSAPLVPCERSSTTGSPGSRRCTCASIRRASAPMCHSSNPPPPTGTNQRLYTDGDPLDLVPFADKVNLCQTIDAAARARDPRVAQVSVGLSGTWSVVEIVRPDGFVATDVRPLVRLNVSIVVEENGRRESGYFGLGGRYMYDHLFEPAQWNRAIDEALAQARVNLRSVAAPAGEMTVLLGPGWPGVLLHEAVGHGLEGAGAVLGVACAPVGT